MGESTPMPVMTILLVMPDLYPQPPVKLQRLAGDVLRCVTEQKEHGLCHFFDGAESLKRDHAQESFPGFLAERRGHVRVHKSGSDRVYPDVVWRNFFGERLRKADHA